MRRGAQGSLLKIIPMRARDPPQNPPTSSPFDSPSIKRGPSRSTVYPIGNKDHPNAPGFPTLSRAFVIIEFRDMLIKSDHRGQRRRYNPGRVFSFSAFLFHAAICHLSSIRRTVPCWLIVIMHRAHERIRDIDREPSSSGSVHLPLDETRGMSR